MAVPVAAIMKGIQIAGEVKDVADTVNTASKALNINQDSVFAKNEEQGKGGAINSIFQAADTLSMGSVSKTYEAVDQSSMGVLSQTVQSVDKVATPILETVDMANGPDVGDVGEVANIAKKLPNMKA